MTPKSRIFTLVILILVVLSIDYLFIHILFPAKRVAFIESLFEKAENYPGFMDFPPGVQFDFPELVAKGEDSFKKALDDCRGDLNLENIESPKQLISYLENNFGIKKRSLQVENIHFFNSQGEEQRIHLAVIDTSEGPKRNLQLYKMGADQLPVPVDLEESQAIDPSPDFFASLLQNKKVTYHLKKETILFANDTVASVEWLNQEPRSFQTALNQKTLTCRYSSCSCY